MQSSRRNWRGSVQSSRRNWRSCGSMPQKRRRSASAASAERLRSSSNRSSARPRRPACWLRGGGGRGRCGTCPRARSIRSRKSKAAQGTPRSQRTHVQSQSAVRRITRFAMLVVAALPGPCGVACRAQGTRDGTCTGAPSCGRRRARSSSGWARALTRARAVTMVSLPHDRVRAFGCSSPMAVSTRPRPRDTRKTTAHLRITRSKFEKCAAHILEDPYFTVGRFLQRQLGETCSFYDTDAYDADTKFLRVGTEVCRGCGQAVARLRQGSG